MSGPLAGVRVLDLTGAERGMRGAAPRGARRGRRHGRAGGRRRAAPCPAAARRHPRRPRERVRVCLSAHAKVLCMVVPDISRTSPLERRSVV